ncbi:2-oxoglutarate dehydrogenase, E2 component, dihydrolipoamide succinyltransferase [Granulicella sp. 5B5]|uniref:2-oxoglutarate dehydrogenase, E2 component, dihydrolipoamide succinyltransferase n=1 Tax=Granulicella sp. 5B5 TaxID=1617967 RepID=UPI0015F531FB|nr:2-oxoglutarate dehydrogenase, E2 component, dihydrolipoamide succinyltransferase [Granulicella sp. 5B5]QMV18845.1 2-oxoglutarate dehydrogenase, E2 component, dihydrolipoamide succinyltransferase [Granulicella sp. 5B5]
MPIDVVMPQMGESITEGTLTKWLKKPGDTVARDEPLFEISTDKVDAEIPSPAAGVLGAIKVEEGATVTVGTVVCAIEEAGSAPAAAPKAETVTPAATTTAASDAAVPAPAPEAAAGPGTEVPMPQMGESITEGTLTKWLKKVGDTVSRDEPIFEISTDKVDAEIPSPVAGTLTEIRVQEGQTVTVGSIVAVIGGGAAAPAAKAAPAAPVAAPTPAPAAPAASAASASAGEAPRSSPLVRKIASENNVDLTTVPGTGASGRITKQDILGHLEGGAPAAVPALAAAAPVAAKPAASAPAAPVSAPTPGELVPLSKMRSIIAKRMVESKATSPHVHTVFKVDMTRIVKLREKEKNKYEQRNGVKLTYMPFITRAAVQALRKHPIVNASMQGEAILYNKNINIGIAVALEWGLIVPVIKQTEEKSFLGIARAIVDVADRARNKKLAPDEVAGGTFTLTNSGIFGEQFGTPIIAQPQSAILGIGGMNKEPVVLTDKDGQDTIAIRTIQRFTLGFDHRTIDGADAGKFMTDFKNYLENWSEDLG